MEVPKSNRILLIEAALLIFTFYLLHLVDYSMEKKPEFYSGISDIYFEYQEAKKIQAGENPYNRLMDGNMIENDKYATLLPLYYYTLAYIRQISGSNLEGFLETFRNVVFWSHAVGGLIIYLLFREQDKKFFGYFAALLFLFNVWSLNSFLNLKQDLPAIALLLLSYYFLESLSLGLFLTFFLDYLLG